MKRKSRAPAKLLLPTIVLMLCGVAALGVSPALATDADISRWYRVDMIVFANQSSRAEGEEKWRRDLGLRYPDNLQALYTEAEYLAKLCAAPATEVPQTEPAFNEQADDFQGWIEDSPASNENLLRQQAVLHPDCLPQAQDDGASTLGPVSLNAVGPSSQRVRQESAAVDSTPPPLPRPFILGDYNDPDLNRALTRLQRSGNFQPLFRGSWVQPMVSRENAPSLLIRGGEQYGEHYELEGFIRLGVERYLHIDTDLWLSRFASQSPSIESIDNADTSRSDWPQLPLPFLNTRQDALTADEDEQLPTESEELEREADAEPGATHTIQRGGNIIIDSRSEAARQRLEQLQDSRPEYRVERTVVMRQQRRMRSNQLHYIDHPLFGVLIKITPLNQLPPWQEAEKD